MDVYQRRRLVALSALAVVFIGFVLLIKSCGGDDEEEPVAPLAGATGTGGATVIPQADYIDQGDAICLEANTSLANVDQSDPVQAARDEADIVAGELEQLQSLPEPDDGTTKLGNFLNALEKQAAAYDDRATAVERDDQETVTELDGDDRQGRRRGLQRRQELRVRGLRHLEGERVERRRLRRRHRHATPTPARTPAGPP